MKKTVSMLGVTLLAGSCFLPTVLYAGPETPITVQYWAPQSKEVSPYGSTWFEISAYDKDYGSLAGLTLYDFSDDLTFSWSITGGDGKLDNQSNWFEGPNLYKSKIQWTDLTGTPCNWSTILVTVDDIGSWYDVSGLTWTNDDPTSRTFKAHVVPEPSTLLLGGSGLVTVMVELKRKRLLKRV